MDIRSTAPADRAQILALHRAAFPDEDLVPLVSELLDLGDEIRSLASYEDDQLRAHIILTQGEITGSAQRVVLLGPCAVTPARQRRGYGSSLIRAGIDQARGEGFARIFVLGDPNYYSRFGFTPENNIETPYALPEEWRAGWQAIDLSGAEAPLGTLRLPEAWMQSSLWTP